jgi:hypothetical protein
MSLLPRISQISRLSKKMTHDSSLFLWQGKERQQESTQCLLCMCMCMCGYCHLNKRRGNKKIAFFVCWFTVHISNLKRLPQVSDILQSDRHSARVVCSAEQHEDNVLQFPEEPNRDYGIQDVCVISPTKLNEHNNRSWTDLVWLWEKRRCQKHCETSTRSETSRRVSTVKRGSRCHSQKKGVNLLLGEDQK